MIRRRPLVILAPLLLFAACAEAPAPQEAQPAAEPVVDQTRAAEIIAAAQPVAAALKQTLSSNLMGAMQADGPVGAMEFCNVQALPLTQEVHETQGMEVFRTSRRLRNPANAPDAAAELALAWFEAALAAGEALPAQHVQALPDGSHRYYQALPTAELCLNCHGGPDQLAPGVPEALADLYPTDQATGYAMGELRGLIGITVPAAGER